MHYKKSKVVFGLGNEPFSLTYRNTRHNSGSDLLLILGKDLNLNFARKVCNYHEFFAVEFNSVIFLIYQNYINNSGYVKFFLDYYDLNSLDMLVINDEVTLKYGYSVYQDSCQGHKGHNGIRHLKQQLNTDFKRLKLGIDWHKNLAEYVLSQHTITQKSILENQYLTHLKQILQDKFYDA